jgi:hypothetical protein
VRHHARRVGLALYRDLARASELAGARLLAIRPASRSSRFRLYSAQASSPGPISDARGFRFATKRGSPSTRGETLAMDDEKARGLRLLLLGKGAVLRTASTIGSLLG